MWAQPQGRVRKVRWHVGVMVPRRGVPAVLACRRCRRPAEMKRPKHDQQLSGQRMRKREAVGGCGRGPVARRSQLGAAGTLALAPTHRHDRLPAVQSLGHTAISWRLAAAFWASPQVGSRSSLAQSSSVSSAEGRGHGPASQAAWYISTVKRPSIRARNHHCDTKAASIGSRTPGERTNLCSMKASMGSGSAHGCGCGAAD
jgi:hypothetical protein